MNVEGILADKIHPDIEKVLITSERLQQKVKELGAQITKDYAGKKPTLIGILKGCIMLMPDLIRHINLDCSVDFIAPSSYSGTKSTGIVRLLMDLRENIEGKDVILIEDIVDSGLTMKYLLENFKTRRPKSLEFCVLLDKREARDFDMPVKYRGFHVPNEFVVGYGLDYDEFYRNLPYIGVLKQSRIKKSC
jgi:hypoxanthine phosphoribosyltransferase